MQIPVLGHHGKDGMWGSICNCVTSYITGRKGREHGLGKWFQQWNPLEFMGARVPGGAESRAGSLEKESDGAREKKGFY